MTLLALSHHFMFISLLISLLFFTERSIFDHLRQRANIHSVGELRGNPVSVNTRLFTRSKLKTLHATSIKPKPCGHKNSFEFYNFQLIDIFGVIRANTLSYPVLQTEGVCVPYTLMKRTRKSLGKFRLDEPKPNNKRRNASKLSYNKVFLQRCFRCEMRRSKRRSNRRNSRTELSRSK